MRVLVTGGCGFIGSHLVEALVREGHAVRVVDDLSSGHLVNVQRVREQVDLRIGDIGDPDVAQAACHAVDMILHEAAIPSVPASVHHPRRTQWAGEVATLILLQQAVRAGVRRFILASSCAVYGNDLTLPKSEVMPPTPASPYAASKLACESYLRAFAACHPIETLSLRYFNVFGPRQDPSSPYSGVISIFIDQLAKHHRPCIYGDGTQTRDFCYVDNVVHANRLALNPLLHPTGQAVNIGTGVGTSLDQVLKAVNRIMGSNIVPTHAEPRPGDLCHSRADISLAERLIGYRPVVDFETGLRRTIGRTSSQPRLEPRFV